MKDYKDKYFSVLGDSLSALEGYTEPQDAAFYDRGNKLLSGVILPSDTWWGQVINHLGGQLLVNNSIAGSTVCWNPLYEIQSYACSDERTSSLGKMGLTPDVILVCIGTNDWGRGTPIEVENAENKERYFKDAYKTMLSKLRKNYPNAELWCNTLAVSRCDASPDFSFPYLYRGRHIEEYCQAIKECAKEFNCRLIDLYEIAKPYDTIDCFHPNAEGMKTISEGYIKALEI